MKAQKADTQESNETKKARYDKCSRLNRGAYLLPMLWPILPSLLDEIAMAKCASSLPYSLIGTASHYALVKGSYISEPHRTSA